MRWAGHVARMGQKRNVYGILVGKPEGIRPFVRPRVKGKIILKCAVSRYVGRAWSQLICVRIGTDVRLL
jgi:hypothetical protein